MLNVASVCSGIGSFEHALKKLNLEYELIFACDNDKFCKKNYLFNYKPKKWYDDINDIKYDEYFNKIDLLVGGCPCQSFSIAGLREGLKCEKGEVLINFMKLINNILPKIFIFENVKGILSHDKGKTFKYFIDQFSEYEIEYEVLSGKKINFPQSRERVFVIGYNKNFTHKNKFILSKIKNYKLTEKAEYYYDKNTDDKYIIKNIKWQKWIFSKKQLKKKKMSINGDYLICQTARQYKSWFGNFIIELKKCDDFKYCDEAKEVIKKNKIIPYKYDKDEYDYEYIINNSIVRRLTPNETLKLMGFDTQIFKNVCSDTQTYKQCGNSIIVKKFLKIFNYLYT